MRWERKDVLNLEAFACRSLSPTSSNVDNLGVAFDMVRKPRPLLEEESRGGAGVTADLDDLFGTLWGPLVVDVDLPLVSAPAEDFGLLGDLPCRTR